MNRWIICILAVSFLLGVVGCAEQTPETATDLSSVVSQKESEPISATSNISQKQEESKHAEGAQEESVPTEFTPVESTPSQPQDPPKKEEEADDPKNNLTWKQSDTLKPVRVNYDDYSSMICICNTYEEFEYYIGVSVEKTPYTKEYFKTDSLVLVPLTTPDTATYYIPKALYLDKDTLRMGWDRKTYGAGGCVSETKQYVLEVKGHLKEVKKAHAKATVYGFNKNNKEYVRDTVEYTWDINQSLPVRFHAPYDKNSRKTVAVNTNPQYNVAICNSYDELKNYLKEETIYQEVKQYSDQDKVSVIVIFDSHTNTMIAGGPKEFQVKGDTLYITWEKMYYTPLPEGEELTTENEYYFMYAWNLPEITAVQKVENIYTITPDGKKQPSESIETTLNIFQKN